MYKTLQSGCGDGRPEVLQLFLLPVSLVNALMLEKHKVLLMGCER